MKRARIAREGVALEAHEPQRIEIGADPGADDGFHPFVRESLVGPVNEIEPYLPRQSLNETVSGGAVHDAHGVGPEARQARVRSAAGGGRIEAKPGFRAIRKSSSTRTRSP